MAQPGEECGVLSLSEVGSKADVLSTANLLHVLDRLDAILERRFRLLGQKGRIAREPGEPAVIHDKAKLLVGLVARVREDSFRARSEERRLGKECVSTW